MTEYKGGLARKLAEITAATDWVKKRGENSQQNYNYAQASDIFAVVREPLAERHIAHLFDVQNVETIQFTTSKGANMFLTTVTAVASYVDGETGEVLTQTVVGMGMDSGDKSLPKAITNALKYDAIAVFQLPTGDDPEVDSPSLNDSGEKAEKPKSEPVTTGPTPPKAEQVRTEKAGLTPKQRGLFESEMHRRGLESAGQRKAFITFATGRLSSKQMTSDDLDKALKELKDDASVAVSNALAVV